MEKMSLQDFITTSLHDVVIGIENAKKLTTKTNAHISPPISSNHTGKIKDSFIKTKSGEVATLMSFDIAVTVDQSEGGKVGIGVVSGLLGVIGEKTTKESNERISNIKFCVPIVLP